jgi:hypothetical protein
MTEKLVALRIRALKAFERKSDEGQGTLEYVGMILIAALLVVGVLTVLKGKDLGGAVGKAVDSVLNG